MDLFSKQAVDYSKYRPQYPAELYRFINLHCRNHHYAWDVATGNGQAAVALARSFDKVLATDLSEAQIAQADPHPKIEFRVGSAEERLPEPDECFDLITVATGLHWLNREKFFPEAIRVLKPGGFFAAWAYGFHSSISPEIDRILHAFYFETLKGFWKEANQHVWNGYANIEIPFAKVHTPKIKMRVDWSLDQFVGYCSTWSAVQLYKDERGQDPTHDLKANLTAAWGTKARTVEWKLGLIAGRK